MSALLGCDGPNCQQTTSVTDPYWLTIAEREVIDLQHTDEMHFCSWKCVYDKSYLLSHADAGK